MLHTADYARRSNRAGSTRARAPIARFCLRQVAERTGRLHGVYARATAAVDQYLLPLGAGSQMTICRGLLGQRREIGAVDCGCCVRETGVPGGYRAALDAGVRSASGVSSGDGSWDLCLYLFVPWPDLMGTDPGRRSSTAPMDVDQPGINLNEDRRMRGSGSAST